MTPPPQPKRSSPAKACCLVALGLMGVGAVVVLGGVFGGLRWWGDESKWKTAEQAAWPTPTPMAALASKSPGGAFFVKARKHGGDGRSSHNESHDCIIVAATPCPDDGTEITAQDHALCENDWLACRHSDGGLLHERYGMKLRWLDASRLEVSWTELTGLGPDQHRIWGQRSETYRIQLVRESAASCDGAVVRAELLTPAAR